MQDVVYSQCLLPPAGDLLDDIEGVEWREGSTSSPPLRLLPRVVGQRSSQSRSRMCRSMGADLDQLLREEARLGGGGSEAARLNRLHLLSSSLSLGNNLSSSSLSSCSTPPRCSSMSDLLEGADRLEGRPTRRSHPAAPTQQHHGGSSRQVRLMEAFETPRSFIAKFQSNKTS